MTETSVAMTVLQQLFAKWSAERDDLTQRMDGLLAAMAAIDPAYAGSAPSAPRQLKARNVRMPHSQSVSAKIREFISSGPPEGVAMSAIGKNLNLKYDEVSARICRMKKSGHLNHDRVNMLWSIPKP